MVRPSPLSVLLHTSAATPGNPGTIDARVLKAMVQSSKINAPAVEEALPEHIVDVPQWPIPPDSHKTPN